MNWKSRAFSSLLAFIPVLFPPPAGAQQQEGGDVRTGALRVYLECAARGCDENHFRTEITFVNWVQQLQDSQLYIIMTSQSAGSGDEFQMDFMGREELEGIDDQLSYFHSDTDSEDQRARGLTGVLAVELARYSLLVGQEGPFTVSTPEGAGGEEVNLPPGLQGEVNDPWDYWVFSLGGNVRYDGEDLQNTRQLSANLSANRTTEIWKINFSGRGSYRLKKGEYSDGTPYRDERQEGNLDLRVYYSLAERWSTGIDAGITKSTQDNQDLGARFGGGIEYSFFPYRDWTRRRMTAQALVYARYYNYDLVTLYDKYSETVPQASLRWGLGFRQPWGTANVNATAEAFLNHPTEFYRLSIGGRVSIRIARGLEWNASGEVQRIRDQIFIPLEDLSDEDILLGRRQLPTDSSWNISTGFSFTFGSIYNNIVNNRFGFIGGGGGFDMGGRGG